MEEIKPRPYQIKTLNKIYADLKVKKNVLLTAIMGAGKTFMSVRLIARLRKENHGMRFLVLAHKQELCSQFYSAFQKFTDIGIQGIGICCAGLGEKIIDRDITIASIQTFINVRENYGYAGFTVIDECHRIDINGDTQYNKIINYLRDQRPNCRILGITATPARLGHGYIYGNKCKPKSVNLFDDISHKVTYAELKEAGYLVPLKGVVANHETLDKDLSDVTTHGDFVLDQLGEVMTREVHLNTAVDAIDKYCDGYNSICVFCCTIDHAEKINDMLGDRSTIVHSRLTEFERAQNMEAWTSGRIRIMVSVEILVEGFDYPPLSCLVFARPTLSSTLYLQAVGRVLRTSPGKDHGLLVDLTTNTARFGTDLDNVKITIPKAVEDAEKKENKMFKTCPECDLEVHVALRECYECGYIWPESECIVAEALPDMKEVEFGQSESVEPEIFEVSAAYVDIHESKKSGKTLGKVTIFFFETDYSEKKIFLWLCFQDNYSGYAVKKAQDLWEKIGNGNPFPQDCDEFMQIDSLKKPSHVSVDMSGQYPELVELIFDDDAGPDVVDDNLDDFYDDDIPF